MYEMKGALSGHSPGSAGFPASRVRVSQSPGLTVPDRLISQPHRPRSTGRPASLFRFVRSPGLPGATRRPPVPGTRCKFRFPGLYIVPGETPGWCPFPAVKTFLRPQPASRKSPSQFILGFFPVHILSTEFRRLSACRSGYPLPYAQLLHRSPDVTQRIPAMTAHRNHSVLSRRPSVNLEFPPRPCPSAQPAPARAPPKRPPLPQPRRSREPHPQLARARPPAPVPDPTSAARATSKAGPGGGGSARTPARRAGPGGPSRRDPAAPAL